jgi:hypothetical protein
MTNQKSIEDEFMTAAQQSPFARLVLFMVCLAIAGSCIAGAHYYTIDLPQQKVTPPDNGPPMGYQCKICKANCADKTDIWNCLQECDLVC